MVKVSGIGSHQAAIDYLADGNGGCPGPNYQRELRRPAAGWAVEVRSSTSSSFRSAVHCTVAPDVKLEPEMISVKLPLPSWTELGLMLVMTGGNMMFEMGVIVKDAEFGSLPPLADGNGDGSARTDREERGRNESHPVRYC